MSVGYKPWVDPRLIAKYNVTSTSSPTKLRANYYNKFKSMEIDGVMLNGLVTQYTFNTTGEHTVKYELYDDTIIDNNAFEYCWDLTSVTIPDSVTSIGSNSFRHCTGLTNVTIPDSVTQIGQYTFMGCTGLTSITIPDSVTHIGNSDFDGCSKLTSVTIGNSVINIGNEAFRGCSKLTSITIPNSVTNIEYGVFSSCSKLTNITVNSGNTVYDSRNNCNAIIKTATNTLISGCKTTIIPDSVTRINMCAFDGCSGLTNITIPNGVTSIDYNAFKMCSDLTSITIPNSVTSIGDGAFDGCSGLTSITIGSGVINISSSAFDGCSGLTNINVDSGNTVYDSRNNCNAIIETATNTLVRGCETTIIPDSVTSIGDGAFDGCSGLTNITIPINVTSIGESAFGDCSSLISIISNAITAPTIQDDTFKDIKTNGILTVSSSSTGYDVWMDTYDYYLGLYNWTKVEQ